MDVAFKWVEGAVDFVLEVSIRQLGYIFCYNRNVDELRNRTVDLEDKRKVVDRKIQVARNNGENILVRPEKWCQEAEEKIKDSKEFQDDDETHKKTGCSRSILCLWYRHKLGRKADKMAKEVKSLTICSPQNDVSYKEILKYSDTALSNVGYVDIESRKSTMEDIMKQLEDSTVRMIGVHGPSGVGKTYFVIEIAKKAIDNKLFDVVIIEQVTRNPNYEKIQKEIACHLGLTFEGEGENGRADRLRERLKQKNENTLIILDDLWGELSLNMFGISFDDDDLGHGNIKDGKENYKRCKMTGKEKRASDDYDGNYSPSGYKRCKILLTSRSKEVLSDKMNVKENSIFPLKELNEEEAMKLFKQKAEMADENPNFKPEIVKYCAGLPMAIHMVGKTLRNESESVWEDTLKQLKISSALTEVQNAIEISMKMSYDHLESEEKYIFLLCAQMGHQPLIMDLVKYCIGLGIFKGVHTLGDARDRVSKSIQKLKKSSLLLDDNSNDHYNMHDLHRDVALSIAHKVENVFTWRNDKLDVWPSKDELERCTVISIYKSDIVDGLPEVINCPRLRVFHIDSDYPTLNIPDGFFARMEELRVLILTGIHLLSLPSSIKCLLNLRMLCLERCHLGNLSIIKDLKKLRILSLSGSKIEDWPAELGDLSKLQLLDISDCSIGNLIPPCFISSLSSLEEFYIGKSLITMEVEGETKQSPISVFAQLKHLHELKIIDVCIPSADVFPTDLFLDKLDDYKIVIGDFKTLSMGDFRMPNKYEASRSLALQVEAGMNIHSLDGVKILFKRVENLLLGELNEVQNVVCELNLDGFPDLKKLSIVNNTGIEYIVNSMGVPYPLNAFPKLEFLSLFHLMKIEKICCSPITGGSFSRLKTIKVEKCPKLKNLFFFHIIKFLVSLETIDVSQCHQLKEIVDEGEVSECDQLKEIVDQGEVYEKIEFHGLCSLTLQDLPSLTTFYPNDKHERHRDQTEIVFAENEQSVTTYLSLFGEKVEIPNLESLNLSSIKIHRIWSDQLLSFCFQNLIKLTVDDCCNLTYLCSLSVASNLNKLKGLFVSKCRMMETLFVTEGDSKDYSEECIFPKLEEIHLWGMDMLKDIWPAEVSADSFPSLISVYIGSCGKLDKIFPCHMNGWYPSLDSLDVSFCRSVEVIFEIRCPSQEDASDDTKLQLIDLHHLPNLKQVWSRDPNGVVNFTNLRSISVSWCDKLSYVLPSSVAKGLEKLEDFSITWCLEMEEIVAGSETNNEPLVFPEITSIKFYGLQNMSCFYKGRHPVECPKLKRLAVNRCPKLETCTIESANEEDRQVFSAEKGISNLEYLEIGQKEAEWLKSNLEKYGMHRLKQLCLKSVPSVKILYWLLHRIPNLERLELSDHYSDSPDYSIRELVPSVNTAPRQRLGAVWQLKELTLSGSSIQDIGFERDPLLQRLERLVLYSCKSLINLAHHTVSFTQLTYLVVSSCSRLKKLMAASTAESLIRLTTLKVIDCDELEEIVANDDEGNEEEKVVGNIVFGKLKTVELAVLHKLTCFCGYKNCDVSFPLLEKLILRDCPKMKTFTQSRTRAPKLQNVLVAERTYGEGKWYWEGDLNATIRKVSLDKSHLELYDYPELEQVWCGKYLVPKNSFQNLKTLIVSNIGNLEHVIPSHLLPCFKNLEELEVRNCDAVQVIFNINDNKVTKAMGMFRLESLLLRKLPRLEHVWDKDPEGIIGLQDLSVEECNRLKYVFPASVAKELGMLERLSVKCCEQLVEIFAEDGTSSEGVIGLQALQYLSVKKCNSLKYVFPASMAKDLAMLEELSVKDCVHLVEIFAEDIETASEGDTKSFVFRSVTSLKLRRLPELKYFYPGLHNLEFPVLEELHLHPCKWVILSCQEAQAYLEEQVPVAVEKVNLLIPNLGKLSFDMGAATVTWDLKSKILDLRYLLNFSEQSDGVLYRFLQTLPNVEKLRVLSGRSLKEMFSAERPTGDYARVLSHLKELTLYYLPELKSIGLEHSWIHPIPENLRTLQVESCGQLKNLVPAAGTVSFSNLTDLVVSGCNNLLYLFTSSTAKSLARLEQMKIRKCESMQEIVSTEGDESHESGQIIFEQLQSLSLEELPMLTCFYSGNYTLCFPSLEKVSVYNCLLMKTFCPLIRINQDIVKLSGSVFIDEDAIPWEGDIDTTVRKLNEKKIAESARELRVLELKPHFQEMWRGSLPVPEACFSNLESLVVDGCEFLSEVLPSNLLPFLNKMHRLEVRNCSSVKTIFDLKCITKDRKMSMGPAFPPLPFSLKTLVLEKLPNLESVWNVDSHCEGLSEIVARVEAASEGTNLEFTFPSLTSLTLLDLPKLKCFYCSLRCVQLKKLDQDPHIEDQGCAKEITPNLDNLLLGEKELKMIWHGQCQENHLHKVKVLDLQYFNVESNEFPYGSLRRSFNEVFYAGGPNVYSTGILLQLKGFKLASLSELISIGLEHPRVEESFLKGVETLEATSCSRLRNLVPSSICFSSLMRLTVSNCEDMIHLFNTSTAKSLAQLKHMDISHGKTIQQIVSEEGGESHHNEIVFGQLQELKLEYLPNLESFYKGSLTLSFPSLKKLSVIKCSRMDTFCVGTITANKLSGVQFNYGGYTPLQVDLNFTILKAFKAQLAEFVADVENLELVDKPEVHAIWHGSFPAPFLCFINLKSLVVERCEFLSTAIPSHILGLLCKLEEVVVRKCHSVKTIFEVKDTVKGKKLINAGPAFSPSFRLRQLTFEQLPNLEHVWDSDPQEVIGLQNLQQVFVNGCDSLEMLFPASVAKSLVKLQKLEVQQCGRLVEIVAKDEAAKGGSTKEFVMPCLTSVKLWFLPELECFYPGPHKLECPKLTQVHLFHCDKLKIFTCESQSLPEAQSEYQVGIPLNPQALFLAEEVIPCLEFLAINKEMAMLIWHGQFHAKLLHKLKTVQLQCFHDDSDTFPCGLLQKVPNIEKLVVSCSSFREIFSSERPTVDCAEKSLSHVKYLKLSSMSKLNSIGLEHSWVDPISKNLEKLQIDQCHHLRNVVPCKVSFSSLIDLNVSQCGGLASLFTPSTSRTLSQLKNMSIENCESLEEIVSEEAEESSNDDEEQITFHKLETLSLHSLPRLGRFYGGSVALSFPSLDELSVINCSKMESFCAGAISVNRWTTVKFKKDQSAVLLIVDLNSAIRKAFEGTPLPKRSRFPIMW